MFFGDVKFSKEAIEALNPRQFLNAMCWLCDLQIHRVALWGGFFQGGAPLPPTGLMHQLHVSKLEDFLKVWTLQTPPRGREALAGESRNGASVWTTQKCPTCTTVQRFSERQRHGTNSSAWKRLTRIRLAPELVFVCPYRC